MSETKTAKVPAMDKAPSYCEPHEWLLLASYCGNENPNCSPRRPRRTSSSAESMTRHAKRASELPHR